MKTQKSIRSLAALAPTLFSVLTLSLTVGCAKSPSASSASTDTATDNSQSSQQNFSSLNSAAVSGASLALHFDSFAQVNVSQPVSSAIGCVVSTNCTPVSNSNEVTATGPGSISLQGVTTAGYDTDISLEYDLRITNGADCLSLMQQALSKNLSFDMVVKGGLTQGSSSSGVTTSSGGSGTAMPAVKVASVALVSVQISEIESCTLGGTAAPGAVSGCGQGGELCAQPGKD